MPHLFTWVATISQITIALVFVGSFIVGFYTLRTMQRSNAVATVKSVMDEYRILTASRSFDEYRTELENWNNALQGSELTPHSFYYFQLQHISTIGQFYDYVGLLVMKRLVDFHLLFEILPFPYVFWAETKEFRQAMKEMTYADFWNGFEHLHSRYTQEKSQRDKPRSRKSVLGRLSGE